MDGVSKSETRFRTSEDDLNTILVAAHHPPFPTLTSKCSSRACRYSPFIPPRRSFYHRLLLLTVYRYDKKVRLCSTNNRQFFCKIFILFKIELFVVIDIRSRLFFKIDKKKKKKIYYNYLKFITQFYFSSFIIECWQFHV